MRTALFGGVLGFLALLSLVVGARCADTAPGTAAPPPAATGGAAANPSQRLQPADFVYQGAFRLPEGSNGTSWEWGGDALTYHPGGDPKGAADGYQGSLFGVGHDQQACISEVSIPVPVISRTKNVEELKTAATLQEFRDIRGGLFKDLEMNRVGLAYLPRQGRQTTDKIHFCWGQHYQEGETGPSHGWFELDLARPQTAGPWCIGNIVNYCTNDYMFEIPQAWADAHTPGLRLATGRFRDGGQGGRGPAAVAYGPWNDGNPPAPGTRLKAVPLLQYTAVDAGDDLTMKGYHHADEWCGGAWLTAGDKAAVIFVGTKALGKCWYGFANGVVWPDNPPFPPVPPPPNDDRGWWGERFVGQFLFYDPADLAAVAEGKKKPCEPQPYATLDVDSCLFAVKAPRQKHHVRDVAFDRARGLLYVLEPLADGDKPLVHVWRITPPGPTGGG